MPGWVVLELKGSGVRLVFVDIFVFFRLTYLGYIVVVALHVLEMRLGWGSSIPASVSSSWNPPHA